MSRLRPIGHDQRLALVDHLDELRTRIVWSLLVFVLAFSVCYWQNNRVLDIVNKPVKEALSLNTSKKTNDPDKQNAAFDRQVGAFAKTVVPTLIAARAETKDATVRRQLTQAIKAARGVVAATPTAQTRRPVTFAITEPFLTTFKVAGYAAILLVLPFLLYQLYAFILPAFTPRERRAVMPLLLMIPALFISGVLFGYFVALPRAAEFLLNFNSDNFDIQLRAQDYYSFAILFLAALGAVFQVPVAVMALTRLRVVSTKQLRKNRGYVILGIAVVAAVVTPTPDPVTMLITMAPLVVLFELSILLARVLERRSASEEDESGFDDLDPTLS
ncbi:MAG TPA: twin-arginine translocase subunit TatC [Solirubrobacteraceae bacterium]|nr:twin-arginine translocase subunit TatC [Solirubrobacteraceae bacterium]